MRRLRSGFFIADALLAGFVFAGFVLAALSAATVLAKENLAAPAARVEARSKDLLAVGMVTGEKMSIHISRLIDNAPVRNAVVTVVLRGAAHPATAETDGSYVLEAKELALPGAAAVQFEVGQGLAQESLKGTLDVPEARGGAVDSNNARQLWWWVLNFAVCFGVLWLISRRRKAARS